MGRRASWLPNADHTKRTVVDPTRWKALFETSQPSFFFFLVATSPLLSGKAPSCWWFLDQSPHGLVRFHGSPKINHQLTVVHCDRSLSSPAPVQTGGSPPLKMPGAREVAKPIWIIWRLTYPSYTLVDDLTIETDDTPLLCKAGWSVILPSGNPTCSLIGWRDCCCPNARGWTGIRGKHARKPRWF